MTSTTLPLPPTDGSHPHAQPVVYARPNAYMTTASAWQEEFRLLLLDVAHTPSLRREIDRGAPAEDSTFATRRELEIMLMAQEALQQARKAKKRPVAQNTIPLEKPGDLPAKKRERNYIPTGNPKGRPKGSVAATGKKPRPSRAKGIDARPCAICGEWFTPAVHSAKACSEPCRDALQKRARRAQNQARLQREREARQASAPVTITCADCGEVMPRSGRRQERCNSCSVARAKARNAQWYRNNAIKQGTGAVPCPCAHCGAMMDPITVRRRYCSEECYQRWFRAQARARKAAEVTA